VPTPESRGLATFLAEIRRGIRSVAAQVGNDIGKVDVCSRSATRYGRAGGCLLDRFRSGTPFFYCKDKLVDSSPTLFKDFVDTFLVGPGAGGIGIGRGVSARLQIISQISARIRRSTVFFHASQGEEHFSNLNPAAATGRVCALSRCYSRPWPIAIPKSLRCRTNTFTGPSSPRLDRISAG